MVERAADRAGRAVDQGGGELGAHPVDPRHPQPGRLAEQLGVLDLGRDVGLRLFDDVGSGQDQGGHVVGGPLVAVGFGLDAGQPLGGLAGLVTLAAQLGPPVVPVGGLLLGHGDLGGQPGRGGPGRGRGLVLRGGLLLGGPEPLQPAGTGDVLLGGQAQLGVAGLGPGPGYPGHVGAGLPLGPAGPGQGVRGPVGLVERGGHLGAADGRAEFGL